MMEKAFMGAPASPERKSIKDRILSAADSAAKIALVMSMFLGPIKLAQASSEGEGSPEDVKHKIELAKAALQKIGAEMDKSASTETRTLNNREIKTLKLKSGQEVVMAKDGSYVILMTNNGEKSFYDINGDGDLDRIVINKKGDQGLVENGLYIFPGADELAAEAEVVASLKPEPVKVAVFNSDNTVNFIDMSDGQSGTIDGQSGAEMSVNMQGIYTRQLEDISTEISK